MDYYSNATIEYDAPDNQHPMLASTQGDNVQAEQSSELPILPLRNSVLFPNMQIRIMVARKSSRALIHEVGENGWVGICTQRSSDTEEPHIDDLYSTGTRARIMYIIDLMEDECIVGLHGFGRFKTQEETAHEPYLKMKVCKLADIFPDEEEQKTFPSMLENIRQQSEELAEKRNLNWLEIRQALEEMEQPENQLNYLCANNQLNVKQTIELLEADHIQERAEKLHQMLAQAVEAVKVEIEMQQKAQKDIDKQQREYYLHQQMQAIQKELGGHTPEQDMASLRERAKKKKWSDAVAKTFEDELKKLERMGVNASDYSVQLNYIETMLALPWNEYTTDNLDLKNAQKVLDHDHFGIEQVKERIIEYLAVLKQKGDMKSPIICLYGPPGVGKTSLGKSIAAALGRQYARVSLGGMHDEAEIRGHRRTYIGAMPGRIIQNLQKLKSSNPVFMLDEIDKINADYKGDPSSALLEVLDPEQNSAFHDNFLDIDFDLSKVMFIATANSLNGIPRPLLDRMELIEMSGYLQEEKTEIAARHLIPKEMDNHGITAEQLKIDKKIIRLLVDGYTRESGVRELDRQLTTLMRKVVTKIAMNEPYNVSVTPDDLKEYLGQPRYTRDKYEGNDYAGVVTGLAWTQVGGEILFIESSLSHSKVPKLTLTGNLGNVMKESAVLALEYIKAHAAQFHIPAKDFETKRVHIHVPEGAIPKDGPSAGITMTTALVSAFTRRKVRRNLAMTGEITLRGKVLPVGGIKEKILAAKRAGITDIVLCADNQKDIEEIKPLYLKGLKFHYVHDIMEVIDFALLKQKAAK